MTSMHHLSRERLHLLCDTCCPGPSHPELGKVTLKSNGDEALSDESHLKSNSDEAFNDDFSLKVTAMKRLTLSKKRSDEALNAS